MLLVVKKAMAPHSSTLAWKIPWTEEPGRLQSMGSLGVGHDWATSLSLSCIGEGNGNPLQCSCLENPRDGGAWWAAIYGVARSRTRLKQLSSSSSSSGKEPNCKFRRCKRHGSDPWVRNVSWRRKWQPTPVFFPLTSSGQRSLVSYSPWGHKESGMTERLSTQRRALQHPHDCRGMNGIETLCWHRIQHTPEGTASLDSGSELRRTSHHSFTWMTEATSALPCLFKLWWPELQGFCGSHGHLMRSRAVSLPSLPLCSLLLSFSVFSFHLLYAAIS